MGLDIEELHKEDDPKKLLQKLKNWDQEEEIRYQTMHREWEKNMLFFLGKQWLEQKQGIDGFFILEDDDDHYRPVDNHVARLSDLKRSQVLGKNVRAAAKTNSSKHNDIKDAMLADLTLRAVRVRDEGDELDHRNFIHSQIFGICYRTDFKQINENEYLENPVEEEVNNEMFQCQECGNIEAMEDYSAKCKQCGSDKIEFKNEKGMQPVMNEMGEQMMERIPLFASIEAVVDPFRIKVSEAHCGQDIDWITESSIQDVSYLKRVFEVEAEGFKGYEACKRLDSDERLPRGVKLSEDFASMTAHPHSAVQKDVSHKASTKTDKKSGKCVYRKSYFKPHPKFPYGRLICWTNHAVLYDGKPDIPVKTQEQKNRRKRWHSYTWFPYRLHPLRFEGIAYIEDLIPINKKINSLEAMILEHLDKTACPERIEFTDVQMNNNDASENTIRIEPNPQLPNGGAPSYLQHPQMANEVYRQKERYIMEIEKRGNVTEVMQGIRPAGVDTYRGLELLRDTSESSESELFVRWHNFLKETAELKLHILQECLINQDEELVDLMKKIRDNEDLTDDDIVGFSMADLRNQVNIVMEEQDYLSQSKAAQADKISGFIQSGLLSPDDVQDPYVKVSLMRKLGMSKMPISDTADVEKAERMIKLLEAQDFQRVFKMLMPFDNKGIQLRVLTEWAKSPRFEELDPEIQQATQQLILAIEQQLQASIQTPHPEESGAQVGGPTGSQRLLQ